ncbi:hypothetical protein [Nostoc sp. NMS7]|nr:hypothetical protein [Nostoc sp. NMS7]
MKTAVIDYADHQNLEEAPRAMLKYLGELKRPYLTAVEGKVYGRR